MSVTRRDVLVVDLPKKFSTCRELSHGCEKKYLQIAFLCDDLRVVVFFPRNYSMPLIVIDPKNLISFIESPNESVVKS